MPSELANRVILLLSPSVGNVVGESMVKEACKMIKTDTESLDYKQIKPFLEQLENAMTPRLGPAVAKKTIEMIRQSVEQQKKVIIDGEIDKELDAFLKRKSLPAESDIMSYAKELSGKCGGEAGYIGKKLIDKIRVQVKSTINKRKMVEELDIFLTNIPQPTKTDIDDFINYIRMLKLNFNDKELREQVENERVLRKFQGIREEEAPEIIRFMDFVKANGDKKIIGNAMKEQGLSYLISDEKGINDKSLSELIEIIIPSEEKMEMSHKK